MAWARTTFVATLMCGLGPACSPQQPTEPTDLALSDGAMDAPVSDSGPGDVSSGPDSRDAGTSDSKPQGCTGCHGTGTDPAPPRSVGGETATTVRGVGAHQAHLQSSTWRAAITCTDCHVVPSKLLDKGHIDTALPAEVVFSSLAKAQKAQPAWGGTTCKGVYCHGATLSGGSATAPVWTQVDGSQTMCGGCHGAPPTAKGHSTSKACHMCHKAVVDKNNTIIAPKLHLDGKVTTNKVHAPGWKAGSVHGATFNAGVQTATCLTCHGKDLKGGVSGIGCESCHSGWQTHCNFCHGSSKKTNGAPPATVAGKSDTSLPGVGKHASHVRKGSSHDELDCALCHKTKPTSALSPGHIDPGPAEVVFSGFLKGGTYDYKTSWCKNIYCHGNGQKGSSRNMPWVGTLPGGCFACHNGAVSICSTCHDDQTDGAAMTLSGKHNKHIVDKKLTCDACHSCVVKGNKTITNFKKHQDGVADVCGVNFVAATRSCTPSCHVKRSW